ncbi:Uncharacterised protein [Bordetella pertussis]|nr:Uncharacterised protein [Bordetella pertussis]CFW41224.1 Uncharacterised protein [Bordetella pertussis]
MRVQPSMRNALPLRFQRAPCRYSTVGASRRGLCQYQACTLSPLGSARSNTSVPAGGSRHQRC